jgi:dephospho-CoA kinase
MKLIGLTGGIGAGKSTIAKRFAALGAHIVDADVMARRAVDPGTPALERIVARFGKSVIDEQGALNRSALGDIVFRDPQSRIDLEAIIHPAVHQLTTAEFERIHAEDPEAIVVYDVPLLVEAKNVYAFDRIIVAHAPAQMRIERLTTLRGMSETEARNRVNSQANDDERLAVADDVIDTSRDLEHTIAQVDAIWASFVPGRA